MIQLHFRVGMIEEASALVAKFHYSRRPPSNVQCVGTWHLEGGLFGDYGNAVAACFFSIPPTRWAEDLWELSRLVRRDNIAMPLTGLIAATCAHIRKCRRADLLISFADRTHDHHGGIYQAASWNYAGCHEKRMDGLVIEGVFHPGRSCNSAWGTRSPSRLKERLPGRRIEPHYDEGKHLYWRALTKEGTKKAARLKLESLPYCKPDEQKPVPA